MQSHTSTGLLGRRATRRMAHGLAMDERRSTTTAMAWVLSRSTVVSNPKRHEERRARDNVHIWGGPFFRPNGEKEEGMTYKSRLAAIDERFGREPFPHERARGTIVDRVDQPADVI